uniref:Minor structural glycoprotein GP4 n=1 Tax=Simian hemorrhagic fever virus TaxID=38143 RepID=A0A0A1G740_SHFV|nr:minor structural glycoprotein GP4 [Simian hemorrhagic fever virus]
MLHCKPYLLLQLYIVAWHYCGLLGDTAAASSTPHTVSSNLPTTTSNPPRAETFGDQTCLICLPHPNRTSLTFDLAEQSSNTRLWSSGCLTNLKGGVTTTSINVTVSSPVDHVLALGHCLALAIRLAAHNHSVFFANHSDNLYLCYHDSGIFQPITAIHPGALRWASIITLFIVIARLRSLTT